MGKRIPTIKKIKALHDVCLSTFFEVHHLVKDEVKSVRFKNREVVHELLKFKHFILVDPKTPEVRPIPVLPWLDEDNLLEVDNTQSPLEDVPKVDVPEEDVLEEDVLEAEISFTLPQEQSGIADLYRVNKEKHSRS
ncbi:MAG: hypothetical protein ACTSPB_03000 [Candidatus Thorarchaeota archaeon]